MNYNNFQRFFAALFFILIFQGCENNKLKKNTVRELLLDWYQTHAIERLTEKTNRYAKIIGVYPKTISVRDYKSQWGSCSRDRKISYK